MISIKLQSNFIEISHFGMGVLLWIWCIFSEHLFLRNFWKHQKETSFIKWVSLVFWYLKSFGLNKSLKHTKHFLKVLRPAKFYMFSEHLALLVTWTYYEGWQTALLSIFLFLVYLFTCLNVSVYILMIYKSSKIEPYTFWFNINEM